MFKSRVERRITPPIILSIMLPILLLAFLAMHMVRNETIESAKHTLEANAKDYGMALLDRLQRHASLSGLNIDSGRPVLTIGDQQIWMTDPDSNRGVHIDLPDLAPDVLDVSGIDRCVSLTATPCMQASEHTLSAQWLLRLVSQFDTDVEILVMTSQPRSVALEGIGLITRLFPLVMALLACIVGYAIVVYLRTTFQPLGRLQAVVEEVERGNFSEQVDVSTGDELKRWRRP